MRRNAGQERRDGSDQVGTGRTPSNTRFPWREAVLVEAVGVRYYAPGALPSRSGQTRRASNESRGSEAAGREIIQAEARERSQRVKTIVVSEAGAASPNGLKVCGYPATQMVHFDWFL